ncbi:hypothetical protein P9990_17645 [Prescottella equi]|uniref:hypothetical protein n=1 Tax=Rhodococcus hoagii TaxID=43767 RepID=UPI002574B69E|nr:hypothetical protein [Prescottella equi]WJJ10396.1 hypothetical protein P9990_17645 [Prescottella equi]
MTDHTCRSGPHCSARTRNTEGILGPALTIHPNTLCQSCIRRLTVAVADLWSDYLALDQAIIDRTISAAVGSGVHSTPTPPVPIDVHAAALKSEIAEEAHRCAECIADQLRTTAPPASSVGPCLDLIEANIVVLLGIPAHDAIEWNRAGDDRTEVTLDGPALAIRLVELHRRARLALAVDVGRERMPLPCPICEESTVGRSHGSVEIDCRSCGSAWSREEYEQMTQILATDYADLIPRGAA